MRDAPSTVLPGRDLSARAAQLALRVAALLEAVCTAESGARAAAAFLRSWAGTAMTTRPAPTCSTPLDAVTTRFALTDAERDLLLLAGLPEEHEGLASTFRALHPRSEPYPTAGLAALVLGDGDDTGRATLRRLLTGGAATRHGLVRLHGDGPLFERGLRPADRLWEALHGHDAWPETIERVPVGEPPAGLTRWLEHTDVRYAIAAIRAGDDRTLLITSPDQNVALSRCAAIAAAAGTGLAAGRLDGNQTIGTAHLLTAHAAARDAIPVLVIPAVDGPAATRDLDLHDIPGPVLVCTAPGAARPTGQRPMLTVPIGPLDATDHRTAWRTGLPALTTQAATLAARHPLDPALTAWIAADVRSRQQLMPATMQVPDVSASIRARIEGSLPPSVDFITATVPWDRLVLPSEPGRQLRDAATRLQHQSLVLDDWGLRHHARADRGVRLLFTGAPGTGKTLAAEVVATAIGTDLLRVDVSQVVSKWIGETEKNLAAVFDIAERTQAVLLLDEADALFGARTEITDAHDRYANLETAYLLQRLDHFDGLAVLSTNLRKNIDAAFIRRMDFVIDFPMPDEACRRDLWALHLPPRIRDDDVEYGVLARLYPVPGGWIRNAAIAAAFLAAADTGARVRQAHLISSIRREYAKAARPFPGEPPQPAHRAGSDKETR
ncbi:ATP-binding protein [Actinoplanes solisilvae]|uniref:ATP-binding protein n=1 Tax=Actinoplanes solisilvae TaxID=2486853 RepID=UPI000FD6D6E7|nr:ATP-binding protein [Actinoplanes solisilvae]